MIMPSPLQKISKLIPSLPAGDIPIARKFLDKKDWDSLKELTWSALERLEKALKKDVLPQKYVGISLDDVRELALLCNEYYYIIYPEELEPNDDYNDSGEEI